MEELFLVKGALIAPSHLYLGEEAIAVGAMAALQPDDLTITTYRGHGHALAKDVPAKLCMADCLASPRVPAGSHGIRRRHLPKNRFALCNGDSWKWLTHRWPESGSY